MTSLAEASCAEVRPRDAARSARTRAALSSARAGVGLSAARAAGESKPARRVAVVAMPAVAHRAPRSFCRIRFISDFCLLAKAPWGAWGGGHRGVAHEGGPAAGPGVSADLVLAF